MSKKGRNRVREVPVRIKESAVEIARQIKERIHKVDFTDPTLDSELVKTARTLAENFCGFEIESALGSQRIHVNDFRKILGL